MLLTRSPLSGGRSHLRARLACVKLVALRREVIDSDRLCVRVNGSDEAWHIAIGVPSKIDATSAADPSSLETG